MLSRTFLKRAVTTQQRRAYGTAGSNVATGPGSGLGSSAGGGGSGGNGGLLLALALGGGIAAYLYKKNKCEKGNSTRKFGSFLSLTSYVY